MCVQSLSLIVIHTIYSLRVRNSKHTSLPTGKTDTLELDKLRCHSTGRNNATGFCNTTYDGGTNILMGKADQPLNEGQVAADQPLNEGPVVADQPLNEGQVVADQSQ